MLAKLDGLKLYRQLQRQDAEVSVDVLSFWLPRSALEAGAGLYIAKPVQKPYPLAAADRLLSRYAAPPCEAPQ